MEGDSLPMATAMEGYSHSCASSCSVCLWIFCNALWQMKVESFQMKDTENNQINKQINKQTD